MIIGVPKEIKDNENRVGMVPAGVRMLTAAGHRVLVEAGAGVGSGIEDVDYKAAGAQIVPTAGEAWVAEMVIKVKEPLHSEFPYFREGLILYTYLHLAAEPELTRELVATGVSAVAYETVQLGDGSLPLLTPMSEVAGRMAVQIGAHYLERHTGGSGVLLSGVPGVAPGNVAIIGGGVVGMNAARIAQGMGARVTVLDVSLPRLRQLDVQFGGCLDTRVSNEFNIAEAVKNADLVIGAVLLPGGKAPRIITEAMVKSMRPGSMIVDVAIDQGGIVETIDRVSTHSDPVFIKHGVLHYSVPNIPGAVSRTSTFALTNATAPYALKLANAGVEQAAKADPALHKGVNTFRKKLTCQAVAEAVGEAYTPLSELI